MFFSKLFKSTPKYAFSSDSEHGVNAITNSCSTCRWWAPTSPTVCAAFEKGIPLPILLGYLDHTVPFGDEDLLYEPSLALGVKKAEAPEVVGNFEELHPRYPKGGPKAGKFMPKGSPEYNAAREASLNRFSAKKYSLGRSAGAHKEDFMDKSETQKKREGYQIAKKILTPDTMKEFINICAELKQDIAEGKESYKSVSKPDPTNPKEVIYSPERLKVHDKILSDIFEKAANFKPKEGDKPEFIVLGGPGGAGKSSFGDGASKVYDENTHLKLDNDAIKGMLPDYNPQKAYLFHKEAGDILEKAMGEAKARGLNVVLDATMRSSVLPEIQKFKEGGYKTQAHFMHISPVESAGRALLRWLNLKDGKPKSLDAEGKPVRGRLVPPDVILGMTKNLNNFDEAKNHVDNWSFRRNNVPRGAAPVKVISNT